MLLEQEFTLLGYGRGSAPPSPEALLAEGFSARIDDPLETTFVLRSTLADTLPAADTRQDRLRVILLVAPLPQNSLVLRRPSVEHLPSVASRLCWSGQPHATT